MKTDIKYRLEAFANGPRIFTQVYNTAEEAKAEAEKQTKVGATSFIIFKIWKDSETGQSYAQFTK